MTAEQPPIVLCVPVDLAEELVRDGAAVGPVGEPFQTGDIGGPVSQDVVTLVGMFAASVAILDSATLHRALARLAGWLRRGHKPDPASGRTVFTLSIRTPRGFAHVDLDKEPSAEEMQRLVDAMLRRPDAGEPPLIRLTLDTDCLLDLIDPDSNGRFKREMHELADLVADGTVDMTYAATNMREFERAGPERAAARARALRDHPALSKDPPPSALARLDVSRLDDTSMVLATDEEAELDATLRAILVPHLDNPDPGPNLERKFSDLDNLLAHVRAGRDLFVTGNTNDFNQARCAALAQLGITVLTPPDALDHIKRPT